MSESNLQLLLHAGELEYIIDTINASKGSKSSKQSSCVGGCLFGLWRNSLKQPVIQFVTGSGPDRISNKKGEGRIKELFDNPSTEGYASVLMNDHQLLHLGFWFYGEEEEQNTAKEIALHHFSRSVILIVFEDGRNSGKWSGQYHFRFRNAPEASSWLYREDVLDGHSSFRLYERLTKQIKDSKVSPDPKHSNKNHPDSETRWKFLDNLPSRVEVEEAKTREEQWYSTDEGMQLLQLLFQYFQEAHITPDMSRDTITQDMQFGLGGGYSLDFPANFPKEMPEIHTPDRGKCVLKNVKVTPGEDVCAAVVRAVVDFIQKQQSSGRRGGYTF